jgi:tRNA (guanine37-N1)-methyltransferase
MQFNIITLFPEMFAAMDYGIIGRAKDKGIINLTCWNPRDYTEDNYRKVDDSPYGGGPGQVMLVKPLKEAIQAARCSNQEFSQVIYLTPQGKLLNHNLVKELTGQKNLILVSGRYEGIDERLMEIELGIEISIGDYVLSGGELAAMVLIDAVTRQLPGVVGDADSVGQDSFFAGLLDYPHYTRPEVIDNLKVPEVLIGGNHAEITRFRRKAALGRTWQRRPELLTKIELTAIDRMLLNEFIEEMS